LKAKNYDIDGFEVNPDDKSVWFCIGGSCSEGKNSIKAVRDNKKQGQWTKFVVDRHIKAWHKRQLDQDQPTILDTVAKNLKHSKAEKLQVVKALTRVCAEQHMPISHVAR
jgi:hypothetical protein